MNPGGYYDTPSAVAAAAAAAAAAANARQKRMRTSFKHHQLRVMKTYFELNHNPDAKDLKQLSQKTGLSKRVLQVWFQNARAKYRRNQSSNEPTGTNSLHQAAANALAAQQQQQVSLTSTDSLTTTLNSLSSSSSSSSSTSSTTSNFNGTEGLTLTSLDNLTPMHHAHLHHQLPPQQQSHHQLQHLIQHPLHHHQHHHHNPHLQSHHNLFANDTINDLDLINGTNAASNSNEINDNPLEYHDNSYKLTQQTQLQNLI